MRTLPLSLIGRHAVFNAVVLLSAAACSGDDVSAPRPTVPSVPTAGSQTVLPLRSFVTVSVKDIWGTLINDKVAIEFNAPGMDSLVIFDNTAADKNATPGIITAALPWSAEFTACLILDTINYGIQPSLSMCNTVPGNAYTVDAGTLVMRKFPKIGFYMQDAGGNSIAGGKITLSALSQGYTQTVADGSAKDLSPVNGTIVFRGNRPGTYTWCENVAPAGYFLTSPACSTVNVFWDVDIGVVVKHQPKIFIPLPF